MSIPPPPEPDPYRTSGTHGGGGTYGGAPAAGDTGAGTGGNPFAPPPPGTGSVPPGPPPPGSGYGYGSGPGPLPSYPGYPQGPQGPYGPPPPGGPVAYPAWGQGYSPYQQTAPVNGFAIGSLILGLLCCVPGVGLVLGVVALVQIRRKGQRGTAMAVIGSVLSGLSLLVVLVMIATGGMSAFWDGFEEGVRDDGTGLSVVKGECFDTPGGAMSGDTYYDVDKVPCSKEHDGEVFGVFRVTGHSVYPGDDEIGTIADDRCYALQGTYAMDAWALPSYVDVYYLTPTRDSWDAGDREITCAFGNTTEGLTLTGSLRNDETVLDADQVAYLKAAHLLNTALDSAPGERYAEDDLPGYRAWAGRVADALGEQGDLLRAHDWPSGAREPVAALLEDIGSGRTEWRKAADASDADAFYRHYDKGAALIDGRKTVTARKALGLATTPPSDEDGGDGGGSGDGGGDGGDSGGGDTGLQV
ncbi:DUF4190 domain-containing protein [Streptomyces sp. NPDC047000]|uniref:DUF4190 domain-containing protein n=1 Tax=Streptomyces sp. NPDC047000 TaxID=3155474 RepID=UPI00340B11B5